MTDLEDYQDYIADWDLRWFSPDEFCIHLDHPFNEVPPREIWSNLKPTAEVVDELRHHLATPLYLTSVYRSPRYNELVGGASHSYHMEHMAIDVTPLTDQGASSGVEAVGVADMARTLREWRSAGDERIGGVGLYPSLDFVHVDCRDGSADWRGS